MKNQNYTLGTRGTLNMLNKVVAKLGVFLQVPESFVFLVTWD